MNHSRSGQMVRLLVGWFRSTLIGVNVGGLVGATSSGTITNCYTISCATGKSSVGGLVGQSQGTITDCYAKGGSVAGSMARLKFFVVLGGAFRDNHIDITCGKLTAL